MKKILCAILPVLLIILLAGCFKEEVVSEKPVIYFYPEQETEISVRLDYDGLLSVTYPHSDDGTWKITAQPDGALYDKEGNEYSYIFWEGKKSDMQYDFSEGFCVKGEDTAQFLREVLADMGLTPKEYNEFIVYWLPKMQENEYNIISFQGKNYTDSAVLDISPKPDSVLRVFMAWKASDEFADIPAQEFEAFTRSGFTVVEWGGCEVK